MLAPDGTVKVVDFGIAGFVRSVFSVAPSALLTPVGTPEYAAPEQFRTNGATRVRTCTLDAVAYVPRKGALKAGTPFFIGKDLRPPEPLCSFSLDWPRH